MIAKTLSFKHRIALATVVLVIDKIVNFLLNYYTSLSPRTLYNMAGAILKLIKLYRILFNARIVLEWMVVINPYDDPWILLMNLTQPPITFSRALLPTRSGVILGFDFTIVVLFHLLRTIEKKAKECQKYQIMILRQKN